MDRDLAWEAPRGGREGWWKRLRAKLENAFGYWRVVAPRSKPRLCYSSGALESRCSVRISASNADLRSG